jgi:hypothetical protein
MAIFSQNYSSPSDQAVRDKRSISANTTGPNAPAKTDPASYRNEFVAKFKDSNPRSFEIYSQVFSAKDAEDTQHKIDGLNDQPNFTNKGDQAIAKRFVEMYAKGVERNLLSEDEAINQQTIAAYQAKQPGQGIGDIAVDASSRIKFAGASGTQLS